jgi:hypothetical protein
MAKASLTSLDPAEVKALGSLVSTEVAKEASGKLTVGTHAVDFTVRVTGNLKKGEASQQRFVATAEPWLLLAVALSHLNGVTVESIVNEALTAKADLVVDLKDRADKAIQAVKADTWGPRAGTVTTALTVEKV